MQGLEYKVYFLRKELFSAACTCAGTNHVEKNAGEKQWDLFLNSICKHENMCCNCTD